MKNIVNSKLFFCVFLISISFLLTMLSLDSVRWRTIDVNDPYVTLYKLTLLALMLIVILPNYGQLHNSPFVKNIMVFSTVCFITCSLNANSEINSWSSLINVFFTVFALPLGMLSGKYIYDKMDTFIKRDVVLFVILIPVLFTFYFLFNLSDKFDSDCTYIAMSFLPFIFLFRKKFISVFFLFAYAFIILLAAKRSSTICFGAVLILYFIYLYKSNSLNGKQKFLFRLFVVIAVIISIYLIKESYSENYNFLVSRFSGIRDDEGSGRSDIYGKCLLLFSNSSLIEQLFGHGFTSVQHYIGYAAHNDLMEILIDYGIIALLLYLSFLIRIAIKMINKYQTKVIDSSFNFYCVLCVFVFVGFANPLILSPILEITLMMSFGIIDSSNDLICKL